MDTYDTTGSVFLTSVFTNILLPSTSEQPILSRNQLEIMIRSAEEMLAHYGYIDAPLLIKKLHINAEAAHQVIEEMIRRGLIRYSQRP